MATGDSFYEDEYLLSLLRQGSQDAFTQIYNKYYSMLYSCLAGICKTENLLKTWFSRYICVYGNPVLQFALQRV